MSQYKLTSEILARSKSTAWDAAKLEWSLHEIYQAETPETCLCGHFPIIELCVLANRLNRNLATVGNCCVKKFLGLPSDRIFQAMKRVKSDPGKSLNAESLSHAREKGWINGWEYDFYMNVMSKRKLSSAQKKHKEEINSKFLLRMRRSSAAPTA